MEGGMSPSSIWLLATGPFFFFDSGAFAEEAELFFLFLTVCDLGFVVAVDDFLLASQPGTNDGAKGTVTPFTAPAAAAAFAEETAGAIFKVLSPPPLAAAPGVTIAGAAFPLLAWAAPTFFARCRVSVLQRFGWPLKNLGWKYAPF